MICGRIKAPGELTLTRIETRKKEERETMRMRIAKYCWRHGHQSDGAFNVYKVQVAGVEIDVKQSSFFQILQTSDPLLDVAQRDYSLSFSFANLLHQCASRFLSVV